MRFTFFQMIFYSISDMRARHTYRQAGPKYRASPSTVPHLKYFHLNVNYDISLILVFDEMQFVCFLVKMTRRYPCKDGQFMKSALSLKEMQHYVERICRFCVNQKQNIEDKYLYR